MSEDSMTYSDRVKAIMATVGDAVDREAVEKAIREVFPDTVFPAAQQSAPAPEVETVGWVWRVSKCQHNVILRDSRGNIVMDFVRWGMNGAQPRFNVNGIMKTASELAVVKAGVEHHATWDQDVDNDTARLIASVPSHLSALAAKERECEELRGELKIQDDANDLLTTIRDNQALIIRKLHKETLTLAAENEKLRGVVEAANKVVEAFKDDRVRNVEPYIDALAVALKGGV